jgi:hypothetical protein
LLSLVLGGTVRGLARPIAAWPIGLAAIVLDLALVRISPMDQPWVASFGRWLWVGAIATVLVVLLANARKERGGLRAAWLLAGLGVALNLSVILANDGYMPISQVAIEETGQQPLTETTRYRRAVLLTQTTPLAPLADILPEPAWVPTRRTVNSVGDVLLALGLAAWAFQASYCARARVKSPRPLGGEAAVGG